MELIEKYYKLPEAEPDRESLLETLQAAGYFTIGTKSLIRKKPIGAHVIFTGDYKNMNWKERIEAEVGAIDYDVGEVRVMLDNEHGRDLDKLLSEFEPQSVSRVGENH